MISAILAILGSSSIGSIIGLLGGLANRWLDQKNKKADQEFELKKLEAEREFMKEEYSHRIQVTTIEAEGRAEAAGYDAMAASYSFAVPTSQDGIVDKISKVIRPLLTLAFFFFTIYVFSEISLLMKERSIALDDDKVLELYTYTIQWIFFQAGASIGWWFAMRPGKVPTFKN